MKVVSAVNMRLIEENAHKDGISFENMMVNAGCSCADIICEYIDKSKKITVLCGKGKNGGDGFVVAGRLYSYGYKNVNVISVFGEIELDICRKMIDDYCKNIDIYDYISEKEKCIGIIEKSDVCVDAVFGIGFKGRLDDNLCELASVYNNVNLKFAVDIPSGLESDGKCENEFFHSDITVSMFALKPVHIFASRLCGELRIADIGIDLSYGQGLFENYEGYSVEEVKNFYVKRKFDANKGDFGKVLCITGSYEMTGAAYFCNQGTVEAGAGLVCCAFPDKAYCGIASKLNEPLMLPLKSNEKGRFSFEDIARIDEKLKWADVVAIGCGMGVDEDTKKICEYVLRNCKTVLIIDADGINCISRNIDILKEAECDIILTPHPGEMSRLTGKSISEIQNNRIESALKFAEEYGVTLCLKGANTVVAHKDGRVFVNTTGNPGMARGGMGDVLTGIIAGLIPQTNGVFEGVVSAVFEHGRAGDSVLEKYGSYCKVTPSRVLESLLISFN